MSALSVVIPSRNEMFLSRTIEDVLENMRGDTEIIAVLDGYWPDIPVKDHPKVTLIHYEESIGQREATNVAVKMSQSKYIMKLDAHCALDEGFDVKLMADYEPDWAVTPRMYNLHAFDWLCKCGYRTYQGPKKCGECGSTDLEMDIIWKEKRNPENDHYYFDTDMRFKYWREFKKRPESKPNIAPTLCLLGACVFMSRDRYWELGGLDNEGHGSWGQMGAEISCKSWLSNGKLMVNKKTWFSHLFRTQKDFGFPYPNVGFSKARKYSKKLWKGNNWDGQKNSLQWLLKKFGPVPTWDEKAISEIAEWNPTHSAPEAQIEKKCEHCDEPINKHGGCKNEDECCQCGEMFCTFDEHDDCPDISPSICPPTPTPLYLEKGIIYYTDNELEERITVTARKQLLSVGLPIVSVSLMPIDFGNNIVFNDMQRGYLTMFKQILAGLEASEADVVFFAEHDVIYSKSHFEFIPPDPNIIYYNLNIWQLRSSDGHAVYYDAKRTSQLCAYRNVLIEHYRERVRRVEQDGFSRRIGFEPASHGRKERIDDLKSDTWVSEHPNIDIKHGKNLTSARWSTDKFRHQRNCQNWKESGEIPYWGVTENRFMDFLRDV